MGGAASADLSISNGVDRVLYIHLRWSSNDVNKLCSREARAFIAAVGACADGSCDVDGCIVGE